MARQSDALQAAYDALETFEAQSWRLNPVISAKVRAVHTRRIEDLGGTPPHPVAAPNPVPRAAPPREAPPEIIEMASASDYEIEVGDGYDDPVSARSAIPVDELSDFDLMGDEGYQDTPARTPSRHPFLPLLVVHVGTAEEEVMSLQESSEVSLGRGKSCNIRLKDSRASRVHCRVYRTGPDWCIEDLGSANGTQVDGEFLPPHAPKGLVGGEDLLVGSTRLQFQLTGASDEGAPEFA